MVEDEEGEDEEEGRDRVKGPSPYHHEDREVGGRMKPAGEDTESQVIHLKLMWIKQDSIKRIV